MPGKSPSILNADKTSMADVNKNPKNSGSAQPSAEGKP